jgi:DNA-binding transcriptional regulator/RsmH inhibitor MraZ
MSLQGLYPVTVAADWRVILPRPWRCAFNTHGRPMALVTRRDAGCWRIYFGDGFGAAVEAYAYQERRDVADLRMISDARNVAVDWRARIGVPADLRGWVPVAAPFPAVLVGLGGYAELWSHAAWVAAQDRAIGLDPHLRRLLELSTPFLVPS